MFGVWNVPDAAAVTALGLHALQHRGQEATGIVSFDGERFHSHRGMGLVGDNFGDARVIASLPGRIAIGHNRYATTGETILRNVQPLYADFEFGGFAVAHNGNLTNAHVLRRALVRRGCLFQSTTDSEVFVHLIAISLYSTVVDRLIDALKQVIGAYSLVALSNEALMGVRDPLGVRPLILGRIGNEGTGGWVLAQRDLRAGHRRRRLRPRRRAGRDRRHQRPGRAQHQAVRPLARAVLRVRIHLLRPPGFGDGGHAGLRRAQAHRRANWRARSGVPADVIVPVPDSGVPAAMGYAAESGIPFELGIIRNHYVGRTFIEPTDHIRHLGVKLKHSANRAGAGRQAGDPGRRFDRARHHQPEDRRDGPRRPARAEVHMRISSPPTTHSCFYGIDTPERGKLLAAQLQVDEMAELIGADSLAFISIDGLYRALGKHGRDPAQAALLRRLLHRRLSDRPARPGRQRRTPAQSAGRKPLTPRHCCTAPSRWSPAPAAASARRRRSNSPGSAHMW